MDSLERVSNFMLLTYVRGDNERSSTGGGDFSGELDEFLGITCHQRHRIVCCEAAGQRSPEPWSYANNRCDLFARHIIPPLTEMCEGLVFRSPKNQRADFNALAWRRVRQAGG